MTNCPWGRNVNGQGGGAMEECVGEVENMFQTRFFPVQNPKDQPETNQCEQVQSQKIESHCNAAALSLDAPEIQLFKATEGKFASYGVNSR